MCGCVRACEGVDEGVDMGAQPRKDGAGDRRRGRGRMAWRGHAQPWMDGAGGTRHGLGCGRCIDEGVGMARECAAMDEGSGVRKGSWDVAEWEGEA